MIDGLITDSGPEGCLNPGQSASCYNALSIKNIMTPFSSLREAIATLREKPRELWKLAKPGRMRSRPSRVSIVHIDDFGGTSVNPSQVFRTARGRADLDAMASLAEKLKISIPERGSKSRSD